MVSIVKMQPNNDLHCKDAANNGLHCKDEANNDLHCKDAAKQWSPLLRCSQTMMSIVKMAVKQ